MLRHYLLAILSGALVAASAFAQATGPNGGLLSGKNGYQTELLVSETELVVFIVGHGKVHDTKGLKLKALVQDAGKTTTIDLKEDGNRLMRKLATPVGKGAIVVLTGKDDHGGVISTRYVIK